MQPYEPLESSIGGAGFAGILPRTPSWVGAACRWAAITGSIAATQRCFTIELLLSTGVTQTSGRVTPVPGTTSQGAKQPAGWAATPKRSRSYRHRCLGTILLTDADHRLVDDTHHVTGCLYPASYLVHPL